MASSPGSDELESELEESDELELLELESEELLLVSEEVESLEEFSLLLRASGNSGIASVLVRIRLLFGQQGSASSSEKS